MNEVPTEVEINKTPEGNDLPEDVEMHEFGIPKRGGHVPNDSIFSEPIVHSDLQLQNSPNEMTIEEFARMKRQQRIDRLSQHSMESEEI